MKALLVAAVAALLLVPAAAAKPSYVIKGDRSFAGLGFRTNLAQARSVLGEPDRRYLRQYSCYVSWKAHGITIEFFAFDPDDPCTDGTVLTATMTGPKWYTSNGLAIGSPASLITAKYPKATRHGSSWWLVTRKACEVGGFAPYGSLVARTRNGTVTTFVFQGSVCE